MEILRWTGFGGMLVFIIVGLTSCRPQMRVTYAFTPPANPAGRACITQCESVQSQCRVQQQQIAMQCQQQAAAEYQACSQRSQAAYQSCQQRADNVHNACQASGNTNCFRPVCFPSICIQRRCRPNIAMCEETFRRCYTGCGGMVQARHECIAHCR